MSRLIDADVLSDKIKKWLSGDITGEKLENVINDDCVVSLLQEIYEAPTVDIIDFADYKKTVGQCINSDYCNGWNDAIAEMSTVKFVTCKDCKFYSGNINDDDLRDGFCCLKDVRYFCKRKFDDYCSQGTLCGLNMEG